MKTAASKSAGTAPGPPTGGYRACVTVQREAPPSARARHASAGLGVAMAFAAGVVVALPVAALTSWWLFPLLAWDFACVAYATWVWLKIWPRDPASTARLAVRVDPTRATADVLVQAAAIA